MIIGSSIQLQSFQLGNYSISLDSDELELVKRANYLGLYVKMICPGRSTYLKCVKIWTILFMFFAIFAEYFPEDCYLKYITKLYIQSKLEYGLMIWSCTFGINLGKI